MELLFGLCLCLSGWLPAIDAISSHRQKLGPNANVKFRENKQKTSKKDELT